MDPTAAEAGISRLGQIAIKAHDVERAVAFYPEKLSLKLLFKAPPGLALFDCGHLRLKLTQPSKPEFDHASSILYFVAPDIQAAHARMKEGGVRFEQEPHLVAKMADHDLWMAFFRDSEENLMGLMSEVRRQKDSPRRQGDGEKNCGKISRSGSTDNLRASVAPR
jgi:methylmalonyl-CoA/ethylmalonyl-CoA epimerase